MAELPPLARQRCAAGLTQADLGSRLGVTREFVSMVERGERSLPPRLVPGWAAAVGVDGPTLRALAAGVLDLTLPEATEAVRARISDADLDALRAVNDPLAPWDAYARAVPVVQRVTEAVLELARPKEIP